MKPHQATKRDRQQRSRRGEVEMKKPFESDEKTRLGEYFRHTVRASRATGHRGEGKERGEKKREGFNGSG